MTEGDTGTRNAVFTVSLTPGDLPVTVNYTTVAGTATAGTDFTPVTGSLTFAPGETEKQVTVQVIGDTVPEVNETFFLQLSNASGAAISQ
uniref:Calx-beta domain-containing protein n=1 Tax=Desertifilum tharense IPPAS B-1220 TaxID=1781255 RepID=A0ACD5H665_9CYAN